MTKVPIVGGLIVIDKPCGITSHDVVDRVRQAVRIRRVGHAGTLDPFATGVLPLLLGPCCRLMRFFSGLDKSYRGTIRLGAQTDTCDVTGKVIEEAPYRHITEHDLQRTFLALEGDRDQVPPMFSARKVEGQRLYKLARKGIEVDRPSRRVRIHALRLLSWDREAGLARFEASVSSGTYIRELADAIARELGSRGHLTDLRRTAVGPYLEADAVALRGEGSEEALLKDLIPADKILGWMPAITLTQKEERSIRNGRVLERSPPREKGPVRLLTRGGELLAIGEPTPTGIQPRIVLPPYTRGSDGT